MTMYMATSVSGDVREFSFGWGEDNTHGNADADRFLLQFLRATMKSKNKNRIFNVDAAEKRLIATFEFRRKHRLNERIRDTDPPPKLDVYYKHYPLHRWFDDKRQTLVNVDRLGLMMSYLDTKVMSLDEWEACFAYEMEKINQGLSKAGEKYGIECRGYLSISDFRGAGMGLFGRLSIFRIMDSMLETHFPEMVQKAYIINAPRVVSAVYAAAKSFLNAETARKLAITTHVPTEEFQSMLEIEKLPKFLGGTSDVIVPFGVDVPDKIVEKFTVSDTEQ